ncbi:LysM peptidoglycan-binding domain-containing protein [Nocardioides sp. WV_118_6]
MSTVTLAPRVAPARRTAAPAVRRTGQVRLTRRGRLVVFLFALTAVVAAAIWLAAGSAASRDAAPAPAEVDIITVAPGDTLWDIASDAAATTGDDVRDMMQRIEQLNALDGGTVYVGQDLRVPADS